MSRIGNKPVSAIPDPHGRIMYTPGMTMREHYAGLALAGIVTRCKGQVDADYLAQTAVTLADALIAELEKPKG